MLIASPHSPHSSPTLLAIPLLHPCMTHEHSISDLRRHISNAAGAMGNEHGCVFGRGANLLDGVEVLRQHHHVQHILGGRAGDVLGESEDGFAQTAHNGLQEKGARDTHGFTTKITKTMIMMIILLMIDVILLHWYDGDKNVNDINGNDGDDINFINNDDNI